MQLAFRPAQRATASAFPLRAPISARPKASRSKASLARPEQAPLQLFFVRLVRGKRGRTFTKRWGASANLLFRRAPSNQITARLFRRWASKYAAQAADQTRNTVLKRQLPPFFFFPSRSIFTNALRPHPLCIGVELSSVFSFSSRCFWSDVLDSKRGAISLERVPSEALARPDSRRLCGFTDAFVDSERKLLIPRITV
ncbi:unnamed protein product [Ixodes pacificus]